MNPLETLKKSDPKKYISITIYTDNIYVQNLLRDSACCFTQSEEEQLLSYLSPSIIYYTKRYNASQVTEHNHRKKHIEKFTDCCLSEINARLLKAHERLKKRRRTRQTPATTILK